MGTSFHVRKVIETERVVLKAADARFAPLFVEFLVSQWDHIGPWNPTAAPDFFTEKEQAFRLKCSQSAFLMGTAWKWLMFERDVPSRVIGYIHYFNIVRGCNYGATLGYMLGKEWEGQGLMSESLRATQNEVFKTGKLHRVQANAMPENLRSLLLLEKLGFHREGIAEKFLCINGVWRDHILTACLNADFDDAWLG